MKLAPAFLSIFAVAHAASFAAKRDVGGPQISAESGADPGSKPLPHIDAAAVAASIGADPPKPSSPEKNAKHGELHPDNFPNIRAAHDFHNFIHDIYPLVNNAADLAGINMQDLLDGTPLDWDPAFANSPAALSRRSYLEPQTLMRQTSKIMLRFISRAAEYAEQGFISNIADTLADYIS